MARGSSIHFRPVPAGGLLAVAHNSREVPPHYLLPAEHHLGNVSIVHDDVARIYREKMALASKKALATPKYSPIAEGILNLPDPPVDHPCAEVDQWKVEIERKVRDFCTRYEEVSGHRVLRADIHLDEGHMVDGTVAYNAHAHITVDKTDDRGRVVRMERRERGPDGKIQVIGDRRARGQKLQDIAAEVTALERGKRDSKRQHIDHHAYRALARQGRVLNAADREKVAQQGEQLRQQSERADAASKDAAAARRHSDEAVAAHIGARRRAERERDEAEAAHPERITGREIATGRTALETHSRQHGLDYAAGYKSLRAEWVRENEREAQGGRARPHSQRDYSALRMAHLEIEAERRGERQERGKRERSTHRGRRQTHRARAERDEARARSGPGAGERRDDAEITYAEIAAARAVLERHARTAGCSLRDRSELKRAYDGIRTTWQREGGHTQREYMALKLAQQEMQAELANQRADRERAKRRRDRRAYEARERRQDGFAIGGQSVQSGYRSAELAAARALGIRYEWDPARGKVYRDRQGRELFCAERRRIEMLEHDAAAEHAALKIAAAKWGGAVTIGGSSEFRERMARSAARESIEVMNDDLNSIVMDERERMSRGEPPGSAERNSAQDEIETEDAERDLGR